MDEATLRSRCQKSVTAWERFVAERPYDKTTGISPEIYQSWVRSRAAGVSMTDDRLPPVGMDDKSMVNRSYTDYTVFLHDRFSGFYRREEKLLANVGGAGLWVDGNLQVFHKLGDHRIIEQLRDFNVKYGTSFKENRLGTNAICLADQSGKEEWCIGDENYHQALKQYVTCSSPRMRQGFVEGFMLLVFPIEEFDELRLFLCEYMLEAFYHLYDDHERLEVASLKMITDATLKRTNSAYFLCDTLGRLVEANPEFYRRMHITPQLAAGRPIEQVLTFVPTLTSRFASNKEETFQCAITEQRSGVIHRCTIERFPVMVNSSHSSGMLFIMTDTKSMDTFVKKMSSRNPYCTFDQIVGTSEPFRNVIRLAMAAARSSSNILIQGESGTGKELFAQAIHNQRFPEMDKPFVAINCGGLPRDLLNTELFGYVEGAFTGAKRGGAPGKFELANGGTLFFDEIGEMPLDMQTSLLRALEDRSVTRVGGSTRIPIDVRVLSATNKDLWQMVQDGTFRLDLYYRLNVISINIPPLKERKHDILLLANSFIQEFASEMGKNIVGATVEYETCLQAYDWPGNVRELRNTIERSMNLEDGPLLSDCTFLKSLIKTEPATKLAEPENATPHMTAMPSFRDFEAQRINELLIANGGNKSKVAAEMGISRKTLYSKMKKYGIEL